MTAAAGEAAKAAERVARDGYGRLIAYLCARTRNVAAAQDALADAFAAALRAWPRTGVPRNPDAWLLTVARRRHIDAIRQQQRALRAGEDQAVLLAEEADALAAAGNEIPDQRLALMFACAHPAIDRGTRAPLILQTLFGLNAAEIAEAFLVSPASMGQRLVRAKARLKDAGIPFRIPDPEQLPERLDVVLEAIYAVYSKAWGEIGEVASSALVGEAIWLGRLIVRLLPQEPEPKGLLALILYTEARRKARRGAGDDYIPLEKQDITLWDRALIDEAEALLREASGGGPTGRHQLEAAIQSAHIARRRTGVPNWPSVVALYDHLLALTGSPVAALNRAAALSELEGAARGLAALEEIADAGRLADYQPYWATRAHLLARAGRSEEASEAFTVAIGLSTDTAVRQYLRSVLQELGRG
jgi:RNA polymerase sigma-70 factor (ECF subfamily)